MATQFISDLHLHASRPEAAQAFYRFLEQHTQNIDALYILGDFFDAWIGDDDDDPFINEVAAQLNTTAASGTPIWLMHGNRDFLIGEDFARRAGLTLLPDPTLINLYGRPTVLLHGDSLCTKDTEYMALRQQLRSTQWQAQILAQPLPVRRALAAELRSKSKTMNSSKAEDIMDVTPDAVTELMQEQDVTLMIHGHTHRPARHALDLPKGPGERIVLGDWHDHGWSLYANDETLELRHWKI